MRPGRGAVIPTRSPNAGRSRRLQKRSAVKIADDITVAIVLNRKGASLDDTDDCANEYLSDYEAIDLIIGFLGADFQTRY